MQLLHWVLVRFMNDWALRRAPQRDACPYAVCLLPSCVRRWVDATAGEEAVHAEILERWNRPQHEGGCGNSGRLT